MSLKYLSHYPIICHIGICVICMQKFLCMYTNGIILTKKWSYLCRNRHGIVRNCQIAINILHLLKMFWDLSYNGGGNVEWYNYSEKKFGQLLFFFLQNSPDDLGVWLLDIYPREIKTCIHTKSVHRCPWQLYL